MSLMRKPVGVLNLNTHRQLLADMRNTGPSGPILAPDMLKAHLDHRIAAIGPVALVEFDYVLRVAADIWGAERTAHFSRVLRDARASAKPVRKTTWEKADALLCRLPEDWRSYMAQRICRSKQERRAKGEVIWSADHTKNVICALERWTKHCSHFNLSLQPTGRTLNSYAETLIRDDQAVTVRTAADYIQRILSGLSVVVPGFSSEACSYVALDWGERGKARGATTKTGKQLIGATEIYRLGFQLMNDACARSRRGPRAAKEYRNGLLLAIAVALPQRARALSCLAFGRTICLLDDDAIHIRIPARMLKGREDRKAGEGFDQVFNSKSLSDALLEYQASFRPLLDDSDWLFPSMLSPGAAISEQQIGRLVGDRTEDAFGVRVSVHRIRDNVATEASEHLSGGGRASSALLGHSDLATTQRHYDHSTGIAACRDLNDFIESRRSARVELAL
jgi:integrase